MTFFVNAMCLISMMLVSGCAIRGNGSGIAYGIDGALLVGGVASLAKASSIDCPDPSNDILVPPIVGVASAVDNAVCEGARGTLNTLGGLLLISGGIGMIVNASINGDSTDVETSPKVTFKPDRPRTKTSDPCAASLVEWRQQKKAITRANTVSHLPAVCRARARNELALSVRKRP